jgi:hypothetical protein
MSAHVQKTSCTYDIDGSAGSLVIIEVAAEGADLSG